ncbi:MAG: hypothetical protein GY765_22435 [bacterium]|nr:hypothetical protein [bacterium]
MKKFYCLILVLIFVSIPLVSKERNESEVVFFSNSSLYFYGMLTLNHFRPPGDMYYELGADSANTVGPSVGIGYRIINADDRFYVNLECDYSLQKHDFAHGDYTFHNINFLINGEYVLGTGRKRSTVFVGTGIGVVFMPDLVSIYSSSRYSNRSETEVPLVFQVGAKVPLSGSLYLRGELRFHYLVFGDNYYDDSYYDSWTVVLDDYYWDDTSFEHLSTSFSIGLELHL